MWQIVDLYRIKGLPGSRNNLTFFKYTWEFSPFQNTIIPRKNARWSLGSNHEKNDDRCGNKQGFTPSPSHSRQDTPGAGFYGSSKFRGILVQLLSCHGLPTLNRGGTMAATISFIKEYQEKGHRAPIVPKFQEIVCIFSFLDQFTAF
jgi:hypothetical protein